jgi:FkbH-like protein
MKIESILRILRLGNRYLLDRKFRNSVADAIRRHVQPAVGIEGSATTDYAWSKGRRAFLVGGCELTYVKDALDVLGFRTHHTFDHAGGADPLSEISNPSSPLWNFNPDYVIFSQIQLFRGVVNETQRKGLLISRAQQESGLGTLMQNFAGAIRGFREKSAKPIFLLTYPLTYRPVFGIHEYRSIKDAYSLAELIRVYELKIYELARQFPNVFILDINHALEGLGKQRQIRETDSDGVYEHLTQEGALRVTEKFLYSISALEPALRRIKCAVFDLDGTLWSGVLREDGPGGVSVRVNYIAILEHLAARGILLAICSKNDEAELKHLPEILGESLFQKISVKKLNWAPKSKNLESIARELNVGLEALALFDNDPFERAEVQANAPAVLVLSDQDVLSSLTRLEFEPHGEMTQEAVGRTMNYIEQNRRAESRSQSGLSFENFMHDCEFLLTFRRPLEGEMSRVHELLARTNQLNAMLRRSSMADVHEYYSQPEKYDISAATLQDKFGNYGLIGVGITEKDKPEWKMIELAFSCRAMGKCVEHAFLNRLSQAARSQGARGVAIDFTPTDRNQRLLGILLELQFVQTKAFENGQLSLVRRLDSEGGDLKLPPWFKVSDAALTRPVKSE